MRTSLLWLAVTSLLVGCSNSALDGWDRASINDAEEAGFWSQGSAPQIYGSVGLLMNAMVQRADEESGATGCPTREENGDTVTYRGNCSERSEWFGTLTVVGAGGEDDGTASYRFEDFGFESAEPCQTGGTADQRVLFKGEARLEETDAPGVFRFDFNISFAQRLIDEATCAVESESTFAYDYEGTRTEDGEQTTWNGRGRLGEEARGVVQVSTDDEVVDTSVCATEALSGTTTLEGRDTVAVLHYDGATDCSEDSTVTWTLDGEEMGTLSGVTCTSAAGAPSWLALGALALLFRRRRQSSSSRS